MILDSLRAILSNANSYSVHSNTFLIHSDFLMAKMEFQFLLFYVIQQVETVGDKYMAVSGLPDICENHAVSIARLALDMIDKADSVMMGDQPVVSIYIPFGDTLK